MFAAKIAVHLLAVSWMLAIGLAVVTAAPVSGEESGEQEDTTTEVARGEERWHTPCDGTTPVEDHLFIRDLEENSQRRKSLRINLKEDVDVLVEHSEAVVSHVQVFKNKFRETRFVDETVLAALEVFDTKIHGYAGEILREHPELKSLDINNHDQVVTWVQVSVNKFSWVAAYMGLGREEESLHESVYFRRYFEITEEQVYSILCTLHRILHKLRAPANNPLTHEDAIPENYKMKDDTVLRHQRDYLALRDYRRYLDQFRAEVLSAKESGWRMNL